MAQTVETVARRVKALRRDSGLTAQQLADRMTELGVPWRREVVANLENNRRGTVGVDELLALALVFGVPPVTLLVDERAAEVVLADGAVTTPAQALLWMIGKVPWSAGPAHGRWMDSSIPLRLVERFADESQTSRNALQLAQQMREAGLGSEQLADRDQLVTEFLQRLQRTVLEMKGYGMTVPAIPDDLLTEARARGVWAAVDDWADGSLTKEGRER